MRRYELKKLSKIIFETDDLLFIKGIESSAVTKRNYLRFRVLLFTFFAPHVLHARAQKNVSKNRRFGFFHL